MITFVLDVPTRSTYWLSSARRGGGIRTAICGLPITVTFLLPPCYQTHDQVSPFQSFFLTNDRTASYVRVPSYSYSLETIQDKSYRKI
uniref:Similarity n=1 Tax=Microcystis aeruginosa (strain PCC 7806) TaxID=267872 RepID=A8YGV7_MICA7|nr:unnamed protein product [Microcystis aeruginosa PCC 7806]